MQCDILLLYKMRVRMHMLGLFTFLLGFALISNSQSEVLMKEIGLGPCFLNDIYTFFSLKFYGIYLSILFAYT